MTKAMLLCAGKGTRLGPLSSHTPKPMLPVCNLPILHHGIAHLASQGINEFVINLHHRGEIIEKDLGDGSKFGVSIQYSYEEELLGTGGGLKHALQLLDPDGVDEPFVSLNGKLIFHVDIQALLRRHAEVPESLGTMVVRSTGAALQWGAVDVKDGAKGMQVRNILGDGSYMFCGVHVTRPSVVRNLPDGEACMVRQGYLPWIQEGKTVTAYEHEDGYFAEHSTPLRYLQSNFDLLNLPRSHSSPAQLLEPGCHSPLPEGAIVHQPLLIGEGVSIGENCEIGPNVIVGANSHISPNTKIRNCVAWKNSEIESGQWEGEIFTPQAHFTAEAADPVDQ